MPNLQRLKHNLKKNLFAEITILLSIGVMLYFLFSTDGLEALLEMFFSLRARWLIVACLAAVGTWLLEGYVLHLLGKRLEPRWKFRYSVSTGMIGLLYSALTPFSTGGQPMQIYTMKRHGMDMGMAGSIIAVKTLVYQIVMVLYSLVLVILKLGFFYEKVSNFSFLIIAGLCANSLFITLVILFAVSKKMTDKILHFVLNSLHRLRLCKNPQERYEKIHRELMLFHDSYQRMGRCFGLYVSTAIYTVLQITLNCLIPYFIYKAFNFSEASILTMMAAQAFVTMVSAFVPLPGASGGAEGSFYLFFSMFFTRSGSIVPAILLWRFITYYFNILFGCIFAWIDNRSIEKGDVIAQ